MWLQLVYRCLPSLSKHCNYMARLPNEDRQSRRRRSCASRSSHAGFFAPQRRRRRLVAALRCPAAALAGPKLRRLCRPQPYRRPRRFHRDHSVLWVSRSNDPPSSGHARAHPLGDGLDGPALAAHHVPVLNSDIESFPPNVAGRKEEGKPHR
jgi:hypothetical protein